MTQPTFAFPCEYGFTANRSSYGQKLKISATASGAIPSTTEEHTSAYEIKTVPIPNDVATSLDESLKQLKGGFFYSQFYFDDQQYKYRIVDDTWTWEVIGPTANVFTLNVERLYEPTVEFALDYQIEQTQSITRNFLKIATSSGTATPSINSATIKRSAITTRALSSDGAVSLRDTLQNLAGTTFFAKLYLDDTAKRYRVVDNSWNVGAAGANGAVFDFELEEVLNLGADIPISIAPTTSTRQNYGQRIKIAATSGNAVPSTDAISIDEYSIETASVTPTQASGLTTSLQNLKGSFFYAKIFDNPAAKKYSLVNDEWSQEFSNQDSVIFRFDIREVYEPTIEFAIDYGQSEDQQVSAHIFRLATTSGTATPSATSRSLKTASVRTKPMAKTAATTLQNSLAGLNGSAFYSQVYLDAAPRLYRLQPYQWKWTPEGEDAYVCEFTMAEVMANTTDIPCVDTLNLERTSRVKTVQFGDGYQQSAPDGINSEDYRYSIETLPLSDTQAATVESALSALQGNIFYAKFKNDTQVYKYRLDGSNWSWQSSGRDANVFQFRVKRAYDL